MTRATTRRRLTIITSLEIRIVVYTHLNQINPSKKENGQSRVGSRTEGRKNRKYLFIDRMKN